jgi:hypothetical protein
MNGGGFLARLHRVVQVSHAAGIGIGGATVTLHLVLEKVHGSRG